jgi:hypothetical protein
VAATSSEPEVGRNSVATLTAVLTSAITAAMVTWEIARRSIGRLVAPGSGGAPNPTGYGWGEARGGPPKDGDAPGDTGAGARSAPPQDGQNVPPAGAGAPQWGHVTVATAAPTPTVLL